MIRAMIEEILDIGAGTLFVFSIALSPGTVSQSGDDADDVAIYSWKRCIKGKTQDSTSGIIANARNFDQLFICIGNSAVVMIN